LGLARAHPPQGYQALRIREHVQIRERQALDEIATLGELVFRLTRKSHHHVRSDSGIRHGGARFADTIGVMPGPVLAPHAPQHAPAPDCSGACTCLAMRGEQAIRSSRSPEKSMGSTELNRSRSTSVELRLREADPPAASRRRPALDPIVPG
jgi:hypothetical protein